MLAAVGLVAGADYMGSRVLLDAAVEHVLAAAHFVGLAAVPAGVTPEGVAIDLTEFHWEHLVSSMWTEVAEVAAAAAVTGVDMMRTDSGVAVASMAVAACLLTEAEAGSKGSLVDPHWEA